MIRVLIADDHELMRNGLRAILDAQQDIEVIGEAA
jgi:DNA-binding NarL/FixJ family response regulator